MGVNRSLSSGSNSNFDVFDDNGLVLCNKIIPQELIEHIMCYYLDANSLLKCEQVCKHWNMTMKDYVWRTKAEMLSKRKLSLRPQLAWKDYYFIYAKKLFRSLVKNHSGELSLPISHNQQHDRIPAVPFIGKYLHKGSERRGHRRVRGQSEQNVDRNWIIIENGGNKWYVERPPFGAPAIPAEPDFENSQHCFVTSYIECKKMCTINLLGEGFTTKILDEIQPVIEASEWYCCRFDCPATYSLTVELHDETGHTMDVFSFTDELVGDRQNVWFKVSHEFKNYGKGLRKIIFIHGGVDGFFWAGHYGSKMARACVKVKVADI